MGSFVTNHIQSWGYAALILFGFLEACCIPISSEVTFGFAGVLAYQGHMNLALVVIVGSLAELGGSYASYFVGRKGGRPLVHRLGRYVLITESDINRAERFLVGRGLWAVPVARMLPFVRAFTSIVAGLVEIPAVRFGVLSAIGTVIYAAVLSSIGYGVGSAWGSVSHDLTLATYVIVAVVVVAIVGFVLYRLRQFRREGGPGAGGPAGASRIGGAGGVSRMGGTGPGTGRGRHSADARQNQAPRPQSQPPRPQNQAPTHPPTQAQRSGNSEVW